MLRGLFGQRSAPKLVFSVELNIRELNNLTLSTGRVYISWKVLGGFGKPSGSTRRQEIAPNPKSSGFAVVFGESFKFNVTVHADKDTLMLQDEVVRFRVFHESRSGRLFSELGRVFVNLSEYTGTEPMRDKAFLLQKSKINGTVVVAVSMERIAGFPTYKVPSSAAKDDEWDHMDVDDRHGEDTAVREGTLSVEMLQSRKVRMDVEDGRSTPSQATDPSDPVTPGSIRRRNPGRQHIRNVSALSGRADVRLSVAITESRGDAADNLIEGLLASPNSIK